MKNRALLGVILVVAGVAGLVFVLPAYYLTQWTYQSSTPPSGWTWPGMGWPGGTNPSSFAVTINQAVAMAESYLASLNNPDLAIHEVMEFEYNFYIIYYEKSTGIGAFEMLIWKTNPTSGMMGGMGGMMGGYRTGTGVIMPEPGPNMMWNTKYGMMGGGMMGGGMMGSYRQPPASKMPISKDQAASIATDYLRTSRPDATTEEPDAFYGYYTVHIVKGGKIYGMLSVNGYTGEVWYHSWHGAFIQMREFD